MEKINRILSDFAKVNEYDGVGNDYRLYLLSENTKEDICELIKKDIKATSDDTIELIQLNEWQQDFLSCEFPDSEEYWFGTIPSGYDLKGLTPKEFIIEQLLNTFEQGIGAVYWVKLDIGAYYACSYEEYIFVTNKGIYYLSMQVHD
ncbi:hypothetical protein COM83_33175 [Bacillus cereus]|nr:hypothetical protein COM83_33175 [Bacillus cereus]PFH75049.1 hypothetical protein COI61_20090 [Bacillus cereus]PFJ46031.1 hypothetical protein COI99_26810 [Bacillus cereus]PFW05829.1 hypothetical protein COL18_29090 [Bacillus cereus]PGW91378.1 hypothetical protein COE40_30705 [Bacillus cereus]